MNDNPFARHPTPVQLSGFAKPPFESVSDVFARLLAVQERGGAALAIYQTGRLVVDLVGGEYSVDSVQPLFSVSKAITAVAAARVHDAGLIDLDAPLSHYWPAFSRSTTKAITLRMVLSHRSGLASLDRDLSIDAVLAGEADSAIEEQDPYWEPGSSHGYHSFTFGLIVDGVFRRALGENVGEYVSREFAAPLALDLWLGIPQDKLDRVHRTTIADQWITPFRESFRRSSKIPPGISERIRRRIDLANDERFLTACWPAVSGISSARSLARFMAATLGAVDGVRLLDARLRSEMIASRSQGQDRVLGIVTHFGSGIQRPFPQLPMFASSSYGHEGANGCAAFADPEFDIAIAFVTSAFPQVSGMAPAFASVMAAVTHAIAVKS